MKVNKQKIFKVVIMGMLLMSLVSMIIGSLLQAQGGGAKSLSGTQQSQSIETTENAANERMLLRFVVKDKDGNTTEIADSKDVPAAVEQYKVPQIEGYNYIGTEASKETREGFKIVADFVYEKIGEQTPEKTTETTKQQ